MADQQLVVQQKGFMRCVMERVVSGLTIAFVIWLVCLIAEEL